MKKPGLKKYLIRSGIIGLFLFVICFITALFVVDRTNSRDVEAIHVKLSNGLRGTARSVLLSSDPYKVLSEGLESDEYGTAIARIDMITKLYAHAGEYFAVLHDRNGNVISDPSRAVFFKVEERDSNDGDKKTVTLETEYNDDWKEILEARDKAQEEYAIASGMQNRTGYYDNSGDSGEDEDNIEFPMESVGIYMDELYVKGGHFYPGKVHLLVKAVYSSRSDGVVKEILTKDMTPEYPEEYEKITKAQGRYTYDETTRQPQAVGVDKDSYLWKDYEYYTKELYKDFDYEEFADETNIGETEMTYRTDKEFMHHLDGSIMGLNVNNNLSGAEYVLISLFDYSILNSRDGQLMDHLGEEDQVNLFTRFWIPIGLFVMLLFDGMALVIGGLRYTKAKASYDIKCYRIETTNAMAHDLKTPLTAISGYAENLLEQVQVDKREHYAKAIISNIEYMDQMIHDILELSKSEDERQTVSIENLELSEFVNEELNSFIHIIEERGLSVTFSGDCTVKTDRKMMKSLVDNLLSNAVKYAAPESEIQIRLGENAGTAKNLKSKKENMLTIINKLDNPIDKTAEELVKPYVKGDNSRGSMKGSGVGLAIVENVAGKLKYKVSYDITDDTFSVYVRM